jgi:hypothetical protein
VALNVQPALAADGYVYAAGYAALTTYHDVGDKIEVTDNAKDGEGAVGWIAVKQADGSYKDFPHVYNGYGFGQTVTVTQDVVREASEYRIESCIQNGPNGTPYNCGFKYYSGS